MADIKQRIDKIKPYFAGMQVENIGGQQVIYVIVNFPDRWVIDENVASKFDVSIAEDEEVLNQYFFCAKMEQGFDTVFDAIDYNIEKMLSAQERTDLFKKKTQELKDIFENLDIPIETLRTLEFTYKKKQKRVPAKETLQTVNTANLTNWKSAPLAKETLQTVNTTEENNNEQEEQKNE